MSKQIERLFEDPCYFVWNVFHEMDWLQYDPISDLEEDMIRFAMGFDTPPSSKTRIVKGYRMQGKTRIVSIGCSLWRMFRDVNRCVVFSSYSYSHAEKIASTVLECLQTTSFLRHMAPSPNGSSTKVRKDKYNLRGRIVNPQPSVMCLGLTGQKAGVRAHSVFADDMETEESASTLELRDKVEAKIDNFMTWMYDNKPGANTAIDPSEIILPSTSKHDDDSVYERLARRPNVAVRSYPIVYPRPGETVNGLCPLLEKRLKANPSLANTVTTTRMTNEEAHGKLADVLPSTANREYRLLVGSSRSDAYPLRLDDLIIADWSIDRNRAPSTIVWGLTDKDGKNTAIEDIVVTAPNNQVLRRPALRDPLWLPYESTKCFVDPSGRGGDKCGLAIVSYLAGFFYVKVCSGLQGSSDSCDLIAQLCRDHGATELWFEKNADTTETWRQFMRASLEKFRCEPGEHGYPDGWQCGVFDKHHQAQKEVRIIQTLRPIMQRHRLVIPRDVIAQQEAQPEHELQYQLSRITEMKKCLREDGKVDALAGCISLWTTTSNVLVPNEKVSQRSSMANRLDRLVEERRSLEQGSRRHWMMGRFSQS